MVTAVTSATDTSAAAAAMKKSLGMNKDDFLKLFIAQMQYQDPLKPQDPSAMLDQLSQLSLVEQSYNNNTALKDLLTAQNNSNAMSAVSFIGGNVKARGDSIAFNGSSETQLQFNLAVPVASATVSIADESGRVVRVASLGAMTAGDSSFGWDGRDGSGNLLPAGVYHFSVAATTSSGTALAATTYTTGVIDGVTFENGTPALTVGPATIALTDVISVRGV